MKIPAAMARIARTRLKAAKCRDKCHQAPGDEPDGQQEHADILRKSSQCGLPFFIMGGENVGRIHPTSYGVKKEAGVLS